MSALIAVPALYLAAALVGSLLPVNRGWTEPVEGPAVYIADNGIHADIIVPVKSQGLDWAPLLPMGDFAAPDPQARWIAFGSGEERVYLNTPTWRDISPGTIWSALSGGKRVMHVEYVRARPTLRGRSGFDLKNIAVSSPRSAPISRSALAAAQSESGTRDTDRADAFYRAVGKESAFRTCNTWVARWFRLAGVKTSLWPPFVNGLTWRYRKVAA